jgi:DNA-binding NarL/FixJ family response regulator
MRAWFAGDYDRCLELCDYVQRRRPALARDVVLLRARALLRLNRPQDVLTALSSSPLSTALFDASITARMLTGAAYIRLGEIDKGLAILDAAETDARAGGAHSTIRSEISLYRGLAYYCRRDLETADRILTSVSPDTDLIHALALSYRGWVATARAQYDLATFFFRESISALDACRHYELALEANVLQALSYLAVERIDRVTWSFIEARAPRLSLTSSACEIPRFWLSMAKCYMEELAGNQDGAVAAGRIAEEDAPTKAYRVQARLRRAAIARFVGESIHQRDHTRSAHQVFSQIPIDEMHGDERIVALTMAEELVLIGSVDAARIVLDIYRTNPPRRMTLAMADDPRARAYQRFVEGLLAHGLGDSVEAQRAVRDAFEIFHLIGYRRRTLLAALWLAEHDPKQHDVLTQFMPVLNELSPKCWFRRAAARHSLLEHDDVYRTLAPHEREVLKLVCCGLTTPEIASARGRNPKHIRNVISGVFRAFNVKRRAQLLAECSRRGILTACLEDFPQRTLAMIDERTGVADCNQPAAPVKKSSRLSSR